MTLAVGVHQFLELCGALYLEEDFLTVLRLHFQVELLVGSGGGGGGVGH